MPKRCKGINHKATPKVSGIYVIHNTLNNKRYIGGSSMVFHRMQNHFVAIKTRSYSFSQVLAEDIERYGSNRFEVYLLEYCDKEKLREREQYYINKYKTKRFQYGYNEKDPREEDYTKDKKIV